MPMIGLTPARARPCRIDHSEHRPVVGDGNCGHAPFPGRADSFLIFEKAVQQGVFGMGMQMGEDILVLVLYVS